jgi:hypothetical protein
LFSGCERTMAPFHQIEMSTILIYTKASLIATLALQAQRLVGVELVDGRVGGDDEGEAGRC